MVELATKIKATERSPCFKTALCNCYIISENWQRLSQGKKYHAIFATHSIPQAVKYYQLIKTKNSGLKFTALFDPNISNDGKNIEKEEWIAEILADYNAQFDTNFGYASYSKFKTDLSNRLSHIKKYKNIKPDEQLDLLIVVDQMLTGFDSKWINTLYLDKILEYANLIQAFSRTNRLCDKNDKPFGLIRYYRKPHTMQRNIKRALKLYSGNHPMELFVDNLDKFINKMNIGFAEIANIFQRAGQADFAENPNDPTACAKFVKLFNQLNDNLQAACLLGFTWDTLHYTVAQEDDSEITATLNFDHEIYNKLLARYKDLFQEKNGQEHHAPFDLRAYINEIQTDKIDQDYMNARFDKWHKTVDTVAKTAALNDLHHFFASLSKEDQKFAKQILHDVQSGDLILDTHLTLSDYIIQYKQQSFDNQAQEIIDGLGIDSRLFHKMLEDYRNNQTIDTSDFNTLRNSADKEKAKNISATLI